MVVVLSAATSPAAAQETAPEPASPQSFEVATLKLNKSGGQGGWRNLPGGRFTATNMTLRALARLAYGPDILLKPQQQIVGGPDWIDTDRFDIEAKAATEHDTNALAARNRSLAMLRTLLEERLQLKAALEKREMPIYALVMARADRRLGPQLTPSTTDCASVADDPARRCGVSSPKRGLVIVRGVTMRNIASFLQVDATVGRVVRDETGLTGRFDARVEFTPAFVMGPGGNVPNPEAETGVSLVTAMEDQLGLKLESKKGPVDVLVITSVSRLSAEGRRGGARGWRSTLRSGSDAAGQQTGQRVGI